MLPPTSIVSSKEAAASLRTPAASFLVQFLRFRRGVPEVVRALYLQATSSTEALETAKMRIGAGSWPVRIGALRVMDDRGQALINWLVPKPPNPTYVDTVSRAAKQRMETRAAPGSAPLREDREHTASPDGEHFEVGQPVTYASDSRPDLWRGGFEILGRSERDDTRAYRIRSADEGSDREAEQHNLRKDLGARTRGQ